VTGAPEAGCVTCRAEGCCEPALLGDEFGLCADCGRLQRSPVLARLVRRKPTGAQRGRGLAEFSPVPESAQRGACAGRGPELFFVEDAAAIAQAKVICLTCPVPPGGQPLPGRRWRACGAA
jgi:hypothetical protein